MVAVRRVLMADRKPIFVRMLSIVMHAVSGMFIYKIQYRQLLMRIVVVMIMLNESRNVDSAEKKVARNCKPQNQRNSKQVLQHRHGTKIPKVLSVDQVPAA